MTAAPAPGSGGFQGTRTWYQQVAIEIQQFITAAASALGLLTTDYVVDQETNGYTSGGPSIAIRRTSNGVAALQIKNTGVTRTSEIDLYNDADDDNAGVLSAGIGSGTAFIYSTNTGTGTPLNIEIAADLFTWVFSKTDGSLTLPAGGLKTTTYQISESNLSAYNGLSILSKPRSGNTNSFIAIQPIGTGTASALTLYSNADQANSALMDINVVDTVQGQIALDKTGTGVEFPQFGIYFVVSNKQWLFKPASLTIPDAANIILNTSTGTKIGTATTQKLGFYNSTAVVQPTAVADASGGAVIDAEARTALNALLARMRTLGLIAT